MLKTTPAVFAVGDEYQIMVVTEAPCLFWVRVGDCEYFDESNGILRSLSDLHRVCVPMSELDREKAYTVCVRPIVERKPYFTETENVRKFSFAFRPVGVGAARAYHISDAHDRIEEPVAAARAFGDPDFLILNGDVLNHSGDPSKFDNIYVICEALTKGEIPVVFSRGNHDLRGNFAERFAEYTPCDRGNTYYTFRLGGVWGVVLDCGEDKDDDHAEYGHTVCCHAFRQRQTAFLETLTVPDDPSIHTRLVIVHNPFTRQDKAPFNIEKDLYTRWADVISERVRPHVMICGHVHALGVHPVQGDYDHLGQPCTLVTAAKPGDGYFAGGGFVFSEEGIAVTFTDNLGNTLENHSL